MDNFRATMQEYAKKLKELDVVDCTIEVGVGKYHLLVEDFNKYMKTLDAVYIMADNPDYNGEDSFIIQYHGIKIKFKISK